MKGIGSTVNGLYYLYNEPLSKTLAQLQNPNHPKTQSIHKEAMTAETSHTAIPNTITQVPPITTATLWHQRLGHAPFSKIEKIGAINRKKQSSTEVCLTCPLAKFTKQPYPLSNSRAQQPFELIHIDTWGPYKVPTRAGYRYFLTVVDDYSRLTWVHLLKYKSDAFDAIELFVC